jgi:hypothetical protein
MSGDSADSIKKRAEDLPLALKSKYVLLQKLIIDGFFDRPVSSEEVVLRISEKFGKKWKTSVVQTYMCKFMDADIIHAVKPKDQNRNYWILASIPRDEALKELGKTRKIREIEEELFSPALVKKLTKDFHEELAELDINFGRNGNCTAFLLRKILEKLIIIVFGKNGKQHLLEDKSRAGGWKGLKELLEIASREKISGIPFLIPKTANEIKGIKFLGDTAAHNPLVGVDVKTILPQMPYIITAYNELAKRL